MIWRGLYGEISGARSAVTTSAKTMSPRMAPRGFLLANPDTAIQVSARGGASRRIPGTVRSTTVSPPAIISSSRGIALLVPNPGIEHAVREVDQQIQDQNDRRDEEDDGLQHDEIPVNDAVDQQGPH